jgi:hypothetical protein
MGGAPVGRPRQVKIFLIASGGLIAARILIRPPQRIGEIGCLMFLGSSRRIPLAGGLLSFG